MKVCVDASALLAILLNEPDARHFWNLLDEATVRVMSPVNYWETSVRVQALHGDEGLAKLSKLMLRLEIKITSATEHHANLAADAFARYGKRPARLNLGDCFAYALASAEQIPLIFKGDDFPKTDLSPHPR